MYALCEWKLGLFKPQKGFTIFFSETSRWFSPGTPVSSTNKTDHHDIPEILLKVALNTKPSSPYVYILFMFLCKFRIFS